MARWRTGFLALAASFGGVGLAASCSDAPEPAARSGDDPGGRERLARREVAEIGLRARRELPLNAKPEAALASDLDGNGRPDLVAATLRPGRLAIWLSGAQGLAETPAVVPIGDYPLEPLALAGEAGQPATLVVASRAALTLEWIAFRANGSPERTSIELPAVPRAIALGRLGTDGRERVVLALDGAELAVADAREPAGLSTYPLADALPRCVRVLEGGRAIAVGFQDTRRVSVLAWTEAGLGDPLRQLELGGIPRAFAEVDLDRDGDLELVVAAGESSLFVLGLGLPGGTEGWLASDEPPVEWSTDAVPLAVQGADLDADGAAELVVLHAAALTWSVIESAAERRGRRRAGAYAGQTPRGMAIADFDGDGAPDLAVANRDSLAVSVQRGDGAGAFEAAPSVAVGGFPNGLVCGDLDGDGRPDAVALNSKDNTITVLRNVGGALRAGAPIEVGVAPRSAVLADLDGDGDLDLALLAGDAGGARAVVLANDGRGALAASEATPLGASARALLAVDLTGDGRPELVVSADETDELLALVAESDGWAIATRLSLAPGPRALAALEIDGDPGPELAVALGGAGAGGGVAWIDVHREGERGISLVETARTAVDGAPLELAAADLDDDGASDLVVLSAASHGDAQGSLQVLWRRGASFVAGEPMRTSLHPRSVAAGDLTGDGLPDVIVAAQYAHVVDLWATRLSPTPHLERRPGLGAGVGPMGAWPADLDGDGRLDLVVVNGHSDDVSWALRR